MVGADAATKIHAARLMTYDCAWKLDQGRDVRLEISMIKVFATEMAWEVVDHAMQTFGAMGMTKELPLQLMAEAAHHAHLRRPDRGPPYGDRPPPPRRSMIPDGRAGRNLYPSRQISGRRLAAYRGGA